MILRYLWSVKFSMLDRARQSTEGYGCKEMVWFYTGQEVLFFFFESFGDWLLSKSTFTWLACWLAGADVEWALQFPSLGGPGRVGALGIPGLARLYPSHLTA